jgi:LacI family transcriptional regulator
MVSIKDIARSLGVSPSSVSIVLNGKAKEKRISDELASKILKASQLMGYFPNQAAVSLRTGQSKTIGLLVENISNNFFSYLAKTIEDEVRMFGYNVVYCSTENDPRKGSELIQMLYNQQVDGYLITPTVGMEADIKKLVDRKKPVVLMDRYLESIDLPYVLADNSKGMKDGMEILIKAGYRKVGFVTNDLDLVQMRERERAYKEALDLADILIDEKKILKLKYTFLKDEAIKSISDFLEVSDLDAIFFATNYIGIYGLQSIHNLKIKIREGLGVICFDDHDIFSLHTPAITAIRQPIKEIAITAVRILMGQLGLLQNVQDYQVLLPTKIIFRNSL